jgi:hypothetical protein
MEALAELSRTSAAALGRLANMTLMAACCGLPVPPSARVVLEVRA